MSGVTPANLLAASMAAEPFSSSYLREGIGGLITGTYHATAHNVKQILQCAFDQVMSSRLWRVETLIKFGGILYHL